MLAMMQGVTDPDKLPPSIEELQTKYTFPAGLSVESITRARWMTGNHAPNGADELSAWILILTDIVKRLRAARGEMMPDEAGE